MLAAAAEELAADAAQRSKERAASAAAAAPNGAGPLLSAARACSTVSDATATSASCSRRGTAGAAGEPRAAGLSRTPGRPAPATTASAERARGRLRPGAAIKKEIDGHYARSRRRSSAALPPFGSSGERSCSIGGRESRPRGAARSLSLTDKASRLERLLETLSRQSEPRTSRPLPAASGPGRASSTGPRAERSSRPSGVIATRSSTPGRSPTGSPSPCRRELRCAPSTRASRLRPLAGRVREPRHPRSRRRDVHPLRLAPGHRRRRALRSRSAPSLGTAGVRARTGRAGPLLRAARSSESGGSGDLAAVASGSRVLVSFASARQDRTRHGKLSRGPSVTILAHEIEPFPLRLRRGVPGGPGLPAGRGQPRPAGPRSGDASPLDLLRRPLADPLELRRAADKKSLLKGAYDGMSDALDPFSYYVPASERAAYQAQQGAGASGPASSWPGAEDSLTSWPSARLARPRRRASNRATSSTPWTARRSATLRSGRSRRPWTVPKGPASR